MSVALLALLCLLASCVDNPFEDPPQSAGPPRTVRGTVRLYGGPPHAGALAWLDGFDASARSDSAGDFAVTLPAASSQAGGVGATGVFGLYFYLGNYAVDSVRLPVRTGTFAFPTGDVDDAGSLRATRYLHRLYSIETSISKDTMTDSVTTLFNATVRLHADGNPVRVYYPRRVSNLEAPLILRNRNTGAVTVLATVVDGLGSSDEVVVGPAGYERIMLVTVRANLLAPGDYEIVPFLLSRGVVVPQALLDGFGPDALTPSAQYLRIPFERKNPVLRVRP